MKIGILGSEDLGLKLAEGFVTTGHTFKVGSRSQEKVARWAAKHGGQASAGSFSEAASFGDIIILATLWEGTPDAIRMAETANFAGKVVVDDYESDPEFLSFS